MNLSTLIADRSLADLVVIGLPYAMGLFFVVGCTLRVLIYYSVRRHEWFAREFEKRVVRFVEGEMTGDRTPVSFYLITKRLLEKTYYEAFEVRDRLRRRRNDGLMSLSDRIFMVRQGCAWLVKDLLKQVRFLKWTNDTPKLANITRLTLNHNPAFSRVLGLIPNESTNDILSVLPGLFVVAGILGTFIGIAKGLPTLSGMSIQDVENSKLIMDNFLNEIAFAMKSSILGITFSLFSHFWNMVFYPERVFDRLVERFEGALDLLWYRADNNDFTPGDHSAHSTEKLAEDSVDSQIIRDSRTRDLDKVRKGKAS